MYGDSFKSSLVAVVVPSKEHSEKWAHQNGFKCSYSELCTLTQLREYIISELKSTAERNKVSTFFKFFRNLYVCSFIYLFIHLLLCCFVLLAKRFRVHKGYNCGAAHI